MGAFLKFNKGMLRMPIPVRIWLLVLIVFNMVVPLFYVNRPEALVTVIVFFASVMFMVLLTAWTGFSRMLGFGHVLWVPLLWWLWTRLDQIPADDLFGLWVRALMLLNVISLVIDAIDVTRYIRGDREEVIKGLNGVPDQA